VLLKPVFFVHVKNLITLKECEIQMENENLNKNEESKEKKKETKYSVTGLITNDDINKDVMITTILNSQILRKWTRVGSMR